MNLDSLTHTSGEWLRGSGPESDIVISSRIRLARELAASEGPRGVAVAPQETVSLMVNEEDHLRLQVMHSGFTLDETWQEIDRIDDLLEQRVNYAFSEE